MPEHLPALPATRPDVGAAHPGSAGKIRFVPALVDTTERSEGADCTCTGALMCGLECRVGDQIAK
eukprot:3808564-Prymnesium_polylepis.1